MFDKISDITKNSAITNGDLSNMAVRYDQEKRKHQTLSKAETKEFDRVEMIHEFDDGWKWIIPLTDKGKRKA